MLERLKEAYCERKHAALIRRAKAQTDAILASIDQSLLAIDRKVPEESGDPFALAKEAMAAAPPSPTYPPPSLRDRLEIAYYRRLSAREKADSILRLEPAVSALEPSEAWLAWYWNLPPDAWEEALAVTRIMAALTSAHRALAGATAKRDQFRGASPVSDEAVEYERRVEEIAEFVAVLESALGDTPQSLAKRFGEPPPLKEEIEHDQGG